MTSLRGWYPDAAGDYAADAARLRTRKLPPLLFRSDVAAQAFCIVGIADHCRRGRRESRCGDLSIRPGSRLARCRGLSRIMQGKPPRLRTSISTKQSASACGAGAGVNEVVGDLPRRGLHAPAL